MIRDSTPPALAVLGGLSHRAANSLHGLSSRWSVNPIATKLILGSVLVRSLWNSSTASATEPSARWGRWQFTLGSALPHHGAKTKFGEEHRDRLSLPVRECQVANIRP